MGGTKGVLGGLFDLTGQVAVVTGGSRGLGLQIAEALGEFGASIAITARGGEELAAAAAALRDKGIDADGMACDLSDPDKVAPFTTWLQERFGRVNILVNNAGATWGGDLAEHELRGWQKVMAVNLTGTFLLTQAVGRTWMLPAGRGRIVNVASIEGLRGHHHDMPGTIAYNTSKGGLVNFTRAVAAEWGRHGITCNALAPGYFPSKMTAATLDRHAELVLGRTPRGQLGGPHDLMGAALLFASDAGAHINGQILAIDGGFTAL